jgi:hypothetical protein
MVAIASCCSAMVLGLVAVVGVGVVALVEALSG